MIFMRLYFYPIYLFFDKLEMQSFFVRKKVLIPFFLWLQSINFYYKSIDLKRTLKKRNGSFPHQLC